MNRTWTRAALLGLLLAAPAGCTTLHYHAGAQKPVLANAGLVRPYKVTSQFLERGRRVYLFWGLAPVAGLDGEDLISGRINQGDGIINLTARERYAFPDLLIGLFTAGIVSSRTLEVRGDVVTWAAPAPPTTVVVPPASGGTVVVPPSGGSVVTPPPGGTVVVPPGSGGTVVIPQERP